MNDDRKPRSLFFPMLLVAVGVFLFLINIGTIPGTTWQNMLQYWPVILIIGGLDGLYKRDGWIGPLVLLGLGTVLLLGNLHYLNYSGFALLLRLWPILLIAIGLDVVFGHRGSIWSNLFRVMVGLLLVGGIVWLAALSPTFSIGMKTIPYEQSLDKATQSELHFSVAAGQLIVTGGADKDLLVSGTAGLPKEMQLAPNYSAPRDGRSSLSLEGNGVVIVPINTNINPWDFDINSEIPITLQAEVGVGDLRVDLTGTKVEKIDTELGIGQTILTLPEGEDVSGIVEGAIGELVIRIPKGSNVLIKMDKALVGTSIPSGYERDHDVIRSIESIPGASDITLDVELAIGGLVIEEIN